MSNNKVPQIVMDTISAVLKWYNGSWYGIEWDEIRSKLTERAGTSLNKFSEKERPKVMAKILIVGKTAWLEFKNIEPNK
jgi:hypothetical protein